MNRWFRVGVLGVVALLAAGVTSAGAVTQDDQDDSGAAQDDSGAYVKHDKDDWDGDHHNRAFGVAFGLVNLDEEGLGDDVEPYFTANYRFRIGKHRRSKNQGMRGFLEPEIGYWESDTRPGSASDLLIGLNVLGVTPIGAADFFVGAGIGLHFVDADVSTSTGVTSTSEEALGVNAQFGIDVHVTRKTSIFGVGRFDIIEDRDDLEAKAYVGVRFHF